MAWLFVIVAGLFEIGFAIMLKMSHGFTRLVPSILFVVCAAISFALLDRSLKTLPVGTAYAVWTGIGAAGTATIGMLFMHDPATVIRIASIFLIVAGVVGLNLAGTAAH